MTPHQRPGRSKKLAAVVLMKPMRRAAAFRWLGVVEVTFGPRRPPTPKLELRFLVEVGKMPSRRENSVLAEEQADAV